MNVLRRSKRLRQGTLEETQTNQEGTPSPRDPDSRRLPMKTPPIKSVSTKPELSLERGAIESEQTQGPIFTGPDTPESMATETESIESEPVPSEPVPPEPEPSEPESAPPAGEATASSELVSADEEASPPEPVSSEVEMTEVALQGEFLLPLKDKDNTPPEDKKTVKKGGIPRKNIVNNETFIQHYLHCPYDTKSMGLTGGNYMDKISEKFGLKKVKSDIKIDRPDFSQPDKTSKECKNANMFVDGEELKYEEGQRARPIRPNGEPALCYMTGLPINNSDGRPADGYHCEHYLIIGDIGNSLRLALDEYENIFKKMMDRKKFTEYQELSKSLWREVYKPSQPPSNLLKAEHDFINLNHKNLSVSVNYHNIIRMMTTLVFGYLNKNSHSINFREKFLDDIHGEESTDADKLKKEEAYLHSRINILFDQAKAFCESWNSKLDDKMLINSAASVLTTIRYLHMKKKEQLDKINSKNPSSTAMKSIISFLKVKIGENSANFLKKRLAKSLSVFNNFEKAATKILDEMKYTIPMGGGADGKSTPELKQPKLLGRHDTAPGENTIPVLGEKGDRGILEILRNGEMTDNYNELSERVKTELVKVAIEETIEEGMGLYTEKDFNSEDFNSEIISNIITDLINEGNVPLFEDRLNGRRMAHKDLLKELYDSNEELLNEIIDDISSESIYSEIHASIDFLMSEEMIEYNELLETARAILSPEMGEPELEMGTPEKGKKKKTKKKIKKSIKKKTKRKSHRKKKRKITKKKKKGDLIDKIIDRLV